jgi:Dynein heavy chain C-terminal domain
MPNSLLNSTTPCTPFTPGCYVSGLYLEGAAWSDELGCLVGQDPKVLVVELPIMQIIPVETSKLKLHNTFRTPGLSFIFSILYHLNILKLVISRLYCSFSYSETYLLIRSLSESNTCFKC